MDCLDIDRPFGVILDLLAEVLDMGVDDPVIAVEIFVKGITDEFLPGKDLFWIFQKAGEDILFNGGKRHGSSALFYGPMLQIRCEIAAVPLKPLGQRLQVPGRPSGDGFHPGVQLL